MNKQTKKLLEQAQALAETLDNEYSYSDSGTNYYSVDVKQHTYFDIDDRIQLQPKKYQSELTEYFTDVMVADLYESYLYFEREYAVDCINNLVHIDKTDNDYKLWQLVADNVSNVYFLGRSGGHLCLDGLQDFSYDIERIETDDSYGGDIALELQDIIELMQAVIFVLDWCRNYSQNLDINSELDFRIDEYITELDEQHKSIAEIKQARKLAKKHGYILAQEVKQ